MTYSLFKSWNKSSSFCGTSAVASNACGSKNDRYDDRGHGKAFADNHNNDDASLGRCGTGKGHGFWGKGTGEVTAASGTAAEKFSFTNRNDTYTDRNGVVEKIDGGDGVDTVVLKTPGAAFYSAPAANGYTSLFINGVEVMQTKNIERIVMNDVTLVKDANGNCVVETTTTTGGTFGENETPVTNTQSGNTNTGTCGGWGHQGFEGFGGCHSFANHDWHHGC